MKYIAHCQSGYYAYDRAVNVAKKLDRMPYAQAGIIYYDNGDPALISYETKVCEIVEGWLHCYGTFSATTRKHIGAFLREVAPSVTYHDAKRCYMDDIEMNVQTGETRPAANGMIQTIGTRA